MKTLLLLALLTLAPSAHALDWAGSAGLIYSRNDNWFAGLHTNEPHLDLTLRFDVDGYVSNPGIFAYSGGIAYQRISDQRDGKSMGLSDALTYKVDASLFRHQLSAFTLTGYAARIDTRLQDNPSYTGVGNHTDERYGGTLRLAPKALPALSAGYERLNITDEVPTLALHEATREVLTASLNHSPGPYGLRAQYRGEWNDGTWVTDQNRNFGVTVSEQTTIGTDSRLFLTDAYYERTPTATGVGAYGVTTNVFSGGYQHGGERGEQTTLMYSYSRGLSTIAAGASESQGQSLRGQHDLGLSRDDERRTWIHFLADGSLTKQESPSLSLETSGETVGAQYWYRKNVPGNLWEFGAGPLAALLQMPGEANRVGYGASVSGRLNRDWGANRLGAFYTVDYGSDVYGRRGWSLAQQAGASLGGPAGERGRYQASLVLNARRGWSPVLGDDSVRNIQLTGNYVARRYSLDANAGLQSGIAGNAPPEFLGDGLFLPAGFNSHSFFLRAGGSALLLPGLTSRLQLQASETVFPGQPDVSVVEGIGALVYRYAAFDLSIEDRYTVTSTTSATSKQNLVLFRVARTLGSRDY